MIPNHSCRTRPGEPNYLNSISPKTGKVQNQRRLGLTAVKSWSLGSPGDPTRWVPFPPPLLMSNLLSGLWRSRPKVTFLPAFGPSLVPEVAPGFFFFVLLLFFLPISLLRARLHPACMYAMGQDVWDLIRMSTRISDSVAHLHTSPALRGRLESPPVVIGDSFDSAVARYSTGTSSQDLSQVLLSSCQSPCFVLLGSDHLRRDDLPSGSFLCVGCLCIVYHYLPGKTFFLLHGLVYFFLFSIFSRVLLFLRTLPSSYWVDWHCSYVLR